MLVKNTLGCEDYEEEEPKQEVEIPKVATGCLSKVVDFLEHHAEEPMAPIETPLRGDTVEDIVKQEWYRNFIEMERSLLFGLVTAANYMDIKPLLDLACLRVSFHIAGKTAEEIRVMLNLPKMTPEQEQAAREKHRWIFQD